MTFFLLSAKMSLYILFWVAVALSFALASPAISNAASYPTSINPRDVAGQSTFYGGNLNGGTCSFTTMSSIPSGLYGTAFSGSAWDNAANCGACIKVTGPNGKSITAMIVDECPECNAGHLDLFEIAFEQLGSTSAGTIATSYSFVACGITSPLILHSKSGTSAYWFSMQVVDHNQPVAKLEVSTDGGTTWQATTRQDYNFFEKSSGFGTSSVDVRVTSTRGKMVVVKGLSHAFPNTCFIPSILHFFLFPNIPLASSYEKLARQRYQCHLLQPSVGLNLSMYALFAVRRYHTKTEKGQRKIK
ncbi:RlpA-like double-psi beta-barrel-protein domain-containing protein-containing protein [Xylariales sp. AK1849]|nr:RlpA-like double-psi beta-barrel-protein domain-containing protein-containing protein [Xylariales sp. AK1849]